MNEILASSQPLVVGSALAVVCKPHNGATCSLT
jgi:hypothetical protein